MCAASEKPHLAIEPSGQLETHHPLEAHAQTRPEPPNTPSASLMVEPARDSCDPPGQHTPDTSQSPSTSHQDVRESPVASGHRGDIRNIILFGETGVGKSSIVNMLSERDRATVSNDVTGCTFGSVEYSIDIDGVEYVLWDTAGLNEGEAGSVPGDQALRNLRDLVLKLNGGVSLLVYCIRGTRYRDILKVNFDLFTDIICQKKVPVVVVVTGLENEERMDDWWDDNKTDLSWHGVQFEDFACVTATRGKKNKQGTYLFQKEYEISKGAVRRLISENCPQRAVRIADSDTQWVEHCQTNGAILQRLQFPSSTRKGDRFPCSDGSDNYYTMGSCAQRLLPDKDFCEECHNEDRHNEECHSEECHKRIP